MTKVGLRLVFCFLMASASAADPPFTEESDGQVMPAPKLTPHPSWVSERGFYSETTHTIRYEGRQPQVSENQWAMWRSTVAELPFHEKVTALFLNQCQISVGELEYFSEFKNIKSVTLGHSIEGVMASPKVMSVLPNFEDLCHLHISVHGLSDEHLRVLQNLPKLKYLTIEFPSKNMLAENRRMNQDWKPVSITERSAFEIATVRSLSNLMICRGPDSENGTVEFTKEAINRLVALPYLVELSISADKLFKPGELEKIDWDDLPPFVEFVDVEDVGVEQGRQKP